MDGDRYEIMKKIRADMNLFLDNSLKEAVHVLLPVNLSRTFLIGNKPYDIGDDTWLSGCHYIVHTIIQLGLDKRYTDNKYGSFVPLSSVIIRSICGPLYRRIFIESLIGLKVIECDGKYSKKSHKSFGFRLAKMYRGQDYKHRTINDPGIKNAIIRQKKKSLIKLKDRLFPISHIARWSVDEKLTIDKDEALKYLKDYRFIMSKQISKRPLKKQFRDEEVEFINSRYYKAKHQVEYWENSKRINVDGSGGRLYSRISSLMSPLRNFLKYDNETLVSFDLKNSQPLHLLLILESSFWKKGKSGLTLENLNKDLYTYITKEEDNSPLIMFSNIAKSYAGKAFEFPDFRFLVENGKLYESICNKFFDKSKSRKDKNKFTTRNKTKNQVLRLMYFNPKESYSPSHKVFELFAELFPVEADVMMLLKKRKYKDFPVLLQKLEAKIILERVCKEVFNMSPDIPLFTIHDSIITTEKYAPYLKV